MNPETPAAQRQEDGPRRNALQLSVPTKCCGFNVVVKSQGQFNKRTIEKYICPCGTFRKSLIEVLAYDKGAKESCERRPAGLLRSSDKTDEPPKCLTEGCFTKAQWKGLCASCYGVAKKLITAGETSWEELTKMGLAKQDVKPFEAMFRKLKEGK